MSASINWKRALNSFSVRLIASYLVIILASIAIVIMLGDFIIKKRMSDLSLLMNRSAAYTLKDLAINTWLTSGNWDNAAVLLNSAQALPTELYADVTPDFNWQLDFRNSLVKPRLILSDPLYHAIIDSKDEYVPGAVLSAPHIRNSIALIHEGQLLGHLYLLQGIYEDGQVLATIKFAFSRAFIGIAVVSFLLVSLMSVLFSRYLSRPLQSLSAQALNISQGRPYHAVAKANIQEIDDMTQSFTLMVGTLEKQKTLRQQLISDIAHELRTPLSIVRLEVDAVYDQMISAEDALLTIHSEVQVLEHLINDLRTLSQADAGELEMHFHRENFNSIVEEAAARWLTTAIRRGITIVLDLHDVPNPKLDKFRIQQAIDNYLSNAIKYTGKGGKIALMSCYRDKGIWLEVVDNGAGIGTEAQSQVFERFYREDASRNRNTGGSGLGLAITRQIIALHHGRVGVESEKGVGSKFYLWLPVDNQVSSIS